jgi:hypothetical protein
MNMPKKARLEYCSAPSPYHIITHSLACKSSHSGVGRQALFELSFSKTLLAHSNARLYAGARACCITSSS